MDFTILARKSQTKNLIESCLTVYRHELKLQNSKFKLIVFTERGMSAKEGYRGSVFKLGPKVIGMVLDTALEMEKLIITIAHEMVHVKQYAKGQMTHTKNQRGRLWMGQKIRAEYYDSPWELEAFGKERVLANKVFKIIEKAYDSVEKSKKKSYVKK
jgi:hypothetical protein